MHGLLRTAPIVAALLAFAGTGAMGLAQAPSSKTEARFAGGFRPDACRWPKAARAQQLSGCCQMDLEIGADGRMISGGGECSDPMFLEPTLRCLAAQDFVPATRNGRPVSDLQQLEYEWRASTPPGSDPCARLRTS